MKDWGRAPILQNALGVDVVPLLLKSSVLRLFGKKDQISPTRVFGNVQGRYVLYSTLIYDSNNDSVADYVTDLFGAVQKMAFPLWRIPVNPGTLYPWGIPVDNTQGFSLFIDGAGLPGVPPDLSSVMPSFDNNVANDYVVFMTKINTDFALSSGLPCFNSLYDQIFDGVVPGGPKKFPAERILPTDDYPNLGQNLRIPKDFSTGENRYQVNLSTFDPGKIFQDDVEVYSHRYSTPSEFFLHGPIEYEGGVPVVNKTQSAYIQGDLDLSPLLEVEATALIVVSGKIKIGEIRRRHPKARLVLIALGKGIESIGGRIEAGILAPSGSFSWKGPLDIHGLLCTKTMDSSAFTTAGGTISYDIAFDSTDPQKWAEGYFPVLGPEQGSILKKDEIW